MSLKSEITISLIDDSQRWNKLLSNSHYPNYMQSIKYEYIKKYLGRDIYTFVFTKQGVDIAGFHCSIKRSYLNIISTSDIISGIVLTQDFNIELLTIIIEHFIEFSRTKKVSYIRISPWLPIINYSAKAEYLEIIREYLSIKGFREIANGRHTYWINLNLSEEQLFKNLNSQTKRNIKQAIKAGIEVEITEKYNIEKLEIFYKYYSGLGKRKEFSTLSKERFFLETEALFDKGAALFFLLYQGTIINVAIATTTEISSYYHGALNPDYKKLNGCPSPGHYMQWVMINYLKAKGLKVYDMAFCPGPIPIEEHPSFDMWRFKHGFGGDHIQYMSIYGKKINRLTGYLFEKFGLKV